jgi:hypothetical protein
MTATDDLTLLSPSEAAAYHDPRGARWAYAAGITGTAANVLLLGFFALAPSAGTGNPLGPANDLVGSASSALTIPAAIAIGRCLPHRRSARILQRATLVALAASAVAGPLLVSGTLPFPVTTTVSIAAFGVTVGWIGATSGWLHRSSILPRRTARLGQATAGGAFLGLGLAGASFLLPEQSLAQLSLMVPGFALAAASFIAVPIWFLLVGRRLDRPAAVVV